MYNLYQYRQKMQHTQRLDCIRRKFYDVDEKRRNLNERLSKNYKKKVENFLLTMLEKPVVLTRYKSSEVTKFRDESEEGLLGDANIYVKGFKHQKDRINQALKQNQSLDFQPTPNVALYQFRTRDLSKERKLHPSNIRFKAKTSLERVEEFLQNNLQGELENIDYKKKNTKLMTDIPNNVADKRAFFARLIAKNLLPSLHSKTHFQAVTALYNKLPVGCLNKAERFVQNKDESRQHDDSVLGDFQPNQSKMKSSTAFDNFDPVQASKEVLLKCNVNSRKSDKVPVIKKGDGHMTCAIEDSIGDVYRKIKVWKRQAW